MYQSQWGSLDPASLASTGGIGQDVANCLGISLSKPSASPPTAEQLPCTKIVADVEAMLGPSPTASQLRGLGGLGYDYATCTGRSLEENPSPTPTPTATSTPSASPSATQTVTPSPEPSGPPASRPGAVVIVDTSRGVTVTITIPGPGRAQLVVSTPLPRGETVIIVVRRFQESSGRTTVLTRSESTATGAGRVTFRLPREARPGDTVVVRADGERLALVRLAAEA